MSGPAPRRLRDWPALRQLRENDRFGRGVAAKSGRSVNEPGGAHRCRAAEGIESLQENAFPYRPWRARERLDLERGHGGLGDDRPGQDLGGTRLRNAFELVPLANRHAGQLRDQVPQRPAMEVAAGEGAGPAGGSTGEPGQAPEGARGSDDLRRRPHPPKAIGDLLDDLSGMALDGLDLGRSWRVAGEKGPRETCGAEDRHLEPQPALGLFAQTRPVGRLPQRGGGEDQGRGGPPGNPSINGRCSELDPTSATPIRIPGRYPDQPRP